MWSLWPQMDIKAEDTLIIIPAYNEEKSVQSVIDGLRQYGYHKILVVDDGSNDSTSEIVRRSGVYLARHSINRGVGLASATGFEIARILNPEIIVTFDADGQHHPGDIARLTEPIRKDEADVVIGSRMLSRSAMPWRRVLYNRMANVVTHIVYGFSVSDTQSGLKAFNRKAFNLIKIETGGMEFCSEIVHQIKENDLRFKEVGIKTIYTDYSLSKGQGFLVGVKTLLRLMLSKSVKTKKMR